MSRVLPRPAGRVATAVLAVALGPVLTGCGAGFQAQTYQERTIADVTNAAAGAVAVRAVSIRPGPKDGGYAAGEDAEGTFTLVNDGAEDDRLVEVTSPLAESVDLIETDGGSTVDEVEVPRLGTTGDRYGMVLRSLAEALHAGEYAEVTLRFERNGEVTVQVPVAVTGEYDYERERSDNFHPPGEDTGGRGDTEGDRGETVSGH